MRDQVRAEQLALENMTLSHHRLKEQLEDSRLESLRVKQAEEHQNSVHERQIATLNALVTETEQRHHSELTLLRDELSKVCYCHCSPPNTPLNMNMLSHITPCYHSPPL